MYTLICTLALFLSVNLFGLSAWTRTAFPPASCLAAAAVFLAVNIRPARRAFDKRRLRVLFGGAKLLRAFVGAAAMSCVFVPAMCLAVAPRQGWVPALSAGLACVTGLAVSFWNGILRIYCTSVQLGIKWRVLGALCGMIPVVHLFVLFKMIRLCEREAAVEQSRIELDTARAENALCATRYPLVLVHGIGFRDISFLNYWGRIPAALKRNGARVFYGKQQSAVSVETAAGELAARIDEVLAETGCEKVNLIAHSKGGLDSRYAIGKLRLADRVASLTTVCTPHRGCRYADVLLRRVPAGMQRRIATLYAKAFRMIGDRQPDLLAGLRDLTASACAAMNREIADDPAVFYQSVGSVMRRARGGKLPLNLTWGFVRRYDGENDGLVGERSARWGARYIPLVPSGRRGISHADMIDLNRENVVGFDVLEFYVRLVQDLKTRGF